MDVRSRRRAAMTATTERTLREMLDAMASRVIEAPVEERNSRFESEFEDAFPELVRVRLASDEVSYRPDRAQAALDALKAAARNRAGAEDPHSGIRDPRSAIQGPRFLAAGLALVACIALLVWFGAHRNQPVA